jgi:uncharacterized protein YraI
MSHEKIGLAAALVMLCTLSAVAEPVMVGSQLNLRSGPGAAFAVVAKMAAGAKVEVQRCNGNWCQVTFAGRKGYANRALLVSSDSYASASPQPSAMPTEPRITSTGPLIWQWRDAEWRDEHWRMLEWHNRIRAR